MEEKIYYHQWLQGMKNLTPRYAGKLLQSFPEPQEILEIPGDRLKEMLPPAQFWEVLERRQEVKNIAGMREEYERLAEKGIRFVSCLEKAYPWRLLKIPDPPLGLYYRGRLPERETMSVAVIGSRECSEYGAYVARELGAFLGRRGVDVVSGMARGIDGISQRAALEAGGISYGILGSGVDICYPASNRGLYDCLTDRGGILSTYPPGTPAAGRNFPARNRIVSGLADALVVVEARVKSGTLITVDMALEQGREVYVVPGRVTDRLSDGCNRLLKQGAGVFLDPESFLEELEELVFLKKMTPERSGRRESAKEESGRKHLPAAGAIQAQEGQKQEGEKQEGQKQDMSKQEGQNTKVDLEFAWSRNAPQDLEEELIPVWEKLDLTPKSLEEIGSALEGRYPAEELGILLLRLVMEGKAKQISAGCFCRQ